MRIGTGIVFGLVGLAPIVARGDGPADNVAAKVRQVPAVGIEVGRADRDELEKGLATLGRALDELAARKEAKVAALLPDVRIFHKAVRDALTYREFLAEADVARAGELLAEGLSRADHLGRGLVPWASQTGTVSRGYVSKIDGSVQPYVVVVPESYSNKGPGRFRLDFWLHGRNEDLGEVKFLDPKRKEPGPFFPPDTIVLYPYGRYCNAFKFAGEVDVLEALEDARTKYRIDEDRIVMRGFSMGGAGAWHLAVHHADRWCAANPGAGFSETPEFLKSFQKETLDPTGYERKLWNLYDCPGYARNLRQCPTVAYSGEDDVQKQAADVMEAALKEQGIDLMHVIGPKTRHSYHPEARAEVARRVDRLAALGRVRDPASISFATYTLKYNRMNWLTIDALGEHWTQATVEGDVVDDEAIELDVANVTALTLDFPSGESPFPLGEPVEVRVHESDRESVVVGPRPKSDRSWHVEIRRTGDSWEAGPAPGAGLRKRHDLQGPIDDAFMDSFLFVRPTGASDHPKVRAWADAELARAVERWRRQFRGEARIKDDTAVTDEDIASANLVLWGDPAGNAVLKRIADRLPIRWDEGKVVVGDRKFAAETHAPILVYPNPLNPRRYVVLNSGFTYREYDDLNNARQVPKLPDWAIVDVTTPPDSRRPGKVAAADFFGESWELKPAREE